MHVFHLCAWSAHGSSICARDNLTEGGPAKNWRKAWQFLRMHWFCAWLSMLAGILMTASGCKSGLPFRDSLESVLGTSGFAWSVSGLSLAARFRRGLGTISAERVGAEDSVPRVASGVLGAEICIHLTHAADLDTRTRLSVMMPGFPRTVGFHT